METINMTEAQKALFNLVGHSLFSMPLDISSEVDWAEVLKEGIAQSVPLLAFKNIGELPIGAATSEMIRRYLKKCSETNYRCYKGHEYLHALMTKSGIRYSIIKGVASAYYYPDPAARSMGDVDFYVAPEDLERAKAVFEADGFEVKETDSEHHVCLKKGSMDMEMHFAPIAIPGDKMRPIFLEYWSDLCDKASLTKDVFSEYMLPSDFHHGFIMITHFQLHLMPNGVGLRHLCDFVVFANRFSDEDFRRVFEQRLKRVGLWRLAQIMSLAAVRYLGMPYKAWMGDDYATADALMLDIARGGNFGQREKSRSFEGVFIADYKATDLGKSRFTRVFRTMNKYVKDKWSAVRWCPLLYPVGWVYFSVRFLFKRITGRRKVSVVKSYKESGKRLKLYKSLDLYKPEK